MQLCIYDASERGVRRGAVG
jgi:hypothetical protein